MKSSLNSLFLVLCIVIFSSCEKIIDEKIAVKEPKLVLNAFLNPDSLFSVSVTQSISILARDTFIFISDASVGVYENNTLIEELQYNQGLKTYRTINNKPVPGKTYQIRASKNGFTTAIAESYIPVPVQIASIDTFIGESHSNYYEYSSVKVYRVSFNDPPNEENFYLAYAERISYNFFSKTTYISPYFLMIKSPLIELTGDNLYSDYWKVLNNDAMSSEDNYLSAIYFAFSDKTFNGKSITLDFELPNNDNNFNTDSVYYRFKLCSINKDYFSYINSESSYSSEGDPFTEPVSVFSNVKGGYGIVFGSSSTSKNPN